MIYISLHCLLFLLPVVCLCLAAYDIMTMVTCWHGPSPGAGPDLVPWTRSSGAPAHGAVATWNLNRNTLYTVWSHSYRVLQKRVGGSVEDVQHSVHLAGVICVVVIILSRGAGGGADIIRPVSLSHVVTRQTSPSPDMVLTLQVPVSRTFTLNR